MVYPRSYLKIRLVALLLAAGIILIAPAPALAGEPDLRIVSGLPSITEILFALDLDDAVVGVTTFCTYPPAAARIAKIGGMLNPNIELVMALGPDLVILQDTQQALRDKYAELGIRTLSVPGRASIADTYGSIRRIGGATGRAGEAERLVMDISGGFDGIRRRGADRRPVGALLVIGHEPGALREIYAATAGSFHGELLAIAGGRNCVADSSIPYPRVSKEEILKASPEVIIVLRPDTENPDQAVVKEKKLWAELPYIDAVKHGRVHCIHGDHLLVPGPRMLLIAQALFGCLHPAEEEDGR